MKADAQLPGNCLLVFQIGKAVVQQMEDIFRCPEKQFSRGVDHQLFSAALKKGNAQLRLQLGENIAQGGLGHHQYLGSLGKIFIISDNLKIAKMQDIHSPPCMMPAKAGIIFPFCYLDMSAESGYSEK